MQPGTWEQREEQKQFMEYERRKERAVDPLVPMVEDPERKGEEDYLEWVRR
jgi:hypothetical protein